MKVCTKCGNDKLIEGIRYCLQCGADVENVSTNKDKCCDNKKNENADDKCLVKTRLSVELFEIF